MLCVPPKKSTSQNTTPLSCVPQSDFDELKGKFDDLALSLSTKGASVIVNGPVQNLVVANVIYPGWPSGWRHHGVDPMPFEPPSFTLSLEDLEAAAKVCPAVDCEKGVPEATAPFLVELLRRVHSNPTQRNIYPNPNREDQVLTFATRRWNMRQLVDAMRIMYERIESELSDVTSDASESIQKLAYGAQASLRENNKKVLIESKSAVSAHLGNLRISAETGESWLGVAPADPAQEVRVFGREWRAHLNVQSTILSLEAELGLTEARPSAEDALELSAQLLLSFARLLLRGQPKNLTVILVTESVAAVRIDGGWQKLPAQEAASRLVSNLVKHVSGFVRKAGEKEETPAQHLLPTLQECQAELAGRVGGPLLRSYAAAAKAHFMKMPLGQELPGAGQQARMLLEEATAPSPLTIEGLCDLFGL